MVFCTFFWGWLVNISGNQGRAFLFRSLTFDLWPYTWSHDRPFALKFCTILEGGSTNNLQRTKETHFYADRWSLTFQKDSFHLELWNTTGGKFFRRDKKSLCVTAVRGLEEDYNWWLQWFFCMFLGGGLVNVSGSRKNEFVWLQAIAQRKTATKAFAFVIIFCAIVLEAGLTKIFRENKFTWMSLTFDLLKGYVLVGFVDDDQGKVFLRDGRNLSASRCIF